MPSSNPAVEDPAFWLALAEEARELAAKMGVPEPMLSVAAYYDRVAARIMPRLGRIRPVIQSHCLRTPTPRKKPPVLSRWAKLTTWGCMYWAHQDARLAQPIL